MSTTTANAPPINAPPLNAEQLKNMNYLPVEVLAMILGFFPLDERVRLRTVSRKFDQAVHSTLRSLKQIEFEEYSPDASAQNYLSRTSKSQYWQYFTPYLGIPFWEFLSTSCAQPIEISAVGHEFELDRIVVIGKILRFITCIAIRSFEKADTKIFEKFVALEGFHMEEPDYPWCLSLLAQHRINRRSRVLCLSVPCSHNFECRMKLMSALTGLQRLELFFSSMPQLLPHPSLNEDVCSSLVELKIDGEPNFQNFSTNFSSLKRLTVKLKKVKVEPIMKLLYSARSAIDQLEELTFIGDVPYDVEKELYSLAAHGKQLKSFIFIYDYMYLAANEYREEKEQAEEEPTAIELTSPRLRRLVIQTRRIIKVFVSSEKLHHFEINEAPQLLALKADFRNLACLKLVEVEISFPLSQFVASARRLRILILKQVEMTRNEVVKIIGSLNEMKSIQKIELNGILCSGLQPVEFTSTNEIVYSPKVAAGFQLIMSNIPDLQELRAHEPELVAVFDNNIRAMKIAKYLIIFFRSDRTKCTITHLTNRPHFYFRQVMNNLRVFAIYIDFITPKLMSHLETYCHNIRGIEVTASETEYPREMYQRWTNWVLSQKELRVVFGCFKPDQVIRILENFKRTHLNTATEGKLIINIHIHDQARVDLDDRLHKLVNHLVKRQLMEDYFVPLTWRCKCDRQGEPGPLYKADETGTHPIKGPEIDFNKIETYV